MSEYQGSYANSGVRALFFCLFSGLFAVKSDFMVDFWPRPYNIPSHINMDTTLSGLSDVGRTSSGQAFNVTIPLTIDGTTLARILAEIQWTQNAAYVRNLGMA